MTRFGLLFFALVTGLGSCHLVAKSLEKAFRRPVALAWTSDGLLAVANRDTGSVSLIEVEKRKVVGEVVVVDSDNGEILSIIEMDEPAEDAVRSTVVAAGDQLFIRVNRKLYCIQK